MKVLIGTHNIANNAFVLAKGFKQLGFDTSVAIAFHNPYYEVFDKCIDISDLYQKALIAPDEANAIELLTIKEWSFLLEYDLYIFISSHSLLPGNVDLKLLKKMDKLVISWNCGSELRYSLSAQSLYRKYDVNFPLNSLRINQEKTLWGLARQSPFTDSFSKKLYNTRMIELYATMVVASTPISVLSIRPFISSILMLDVDTNKYHPKIPNNDIPIVVHAPTNPLYKQSNVIVNTMFELWELGYKFEFRLIRNMPNQQLLSCLSEADIVIDQIMCSVPGLLAHEAMSSGCVVLSCNTPYSAPTPKVDNPVLNINNKNIKEVLTKVITNKEYRLNVARESLKYSQKTIHSPKSIAYNLLMNLEKTIKGHSDCYPTIIYDHTYIPNTEYIHPELIRMTNDVISQYGIPNEDSFQKIKRISLTSLTEAPFWNLDDRFQKHLWGYESPFSISP